MITDKEKIRGLQKHLFNCNLEREKLTAEIEQRDSRDNKAIDLIRSFLQIALREGAITNWDGVEKQCRKILDNG